MHPQKYEVEKLDAIDVGVGKWINQHLPDALLDYVTYLKSQYAQLGVDIDVQKLMREFDLLNERRSL